VKPAVLAVLAVCFVAVLGAYVVLALAGKDTAGLVSAVVTLLGVSGLAAHIEQRTRGQDATLAKIEKQTNGVLDARIREGVKTAIAELTAPPPPPLVPPDNPTP
jgi:hypothetical protein